MELFRPEKVSWLDSQLIYHALAKMSRESLTLLSPDQPYVCIGFHQDVQKEVDLDYCRDHNIPVFRRDVGGGSVYLNGDQLFFQLVIHRDNPLVPKNRGAFYRLFLQPVIETYRAVGIPATLKPINDILTGGRKISGTGVGEIDNCIVFVGNLIVDFDYATMSKVLKVPNEKFRDKIYRSLTENLTTMRREIGETAMREWPDTRLYGLLAGHFQKILGPLRLQTIDSALYSQMETLEKRMNHETWLFRKGRRKPGRAIRIRSDVNVVHQVHKAPGGLIRAEYEINAGCFGAVNLSGDFFCYPKEAVVRLEERLSGRPVVESRRILEEFYHRDRVETPGIGIDDWLMVLQDAR
jgi:lipoate-protein ligase A